jgi:deazaflavin-dependent oxidoreductase (nitroreductase family)
MFERLADEDFCYLTTKGRVTGRPHTIEIWFALQGGALYMLSGGGDRSDWVRNIRRHPDVTVRIGRRRTPGRARILGPADPEDAAARRLLAAKYQGWREGRPLSGWARTALTVAVDLPSRGAA